MELITYSNHYQNKLEAFLEIMYSSMGRNFEPEGLQSDIRDIENVYVKNGGNFWLLINEEIVIGTIALKIIDEIDKIGEIKRYFILPSFQNRGLGTMLIDYVFNEARKNDLKIIRLDTMRKSKRAISIFKKKGFYEIEKYNDNDIAEIFMEVKLN